MDRGRERARGADRWSGRSHVEEPPLRRRKLFPHTSLSWISVVAAAAYLSPFFATSSLFFRDKAENLPVKLDESSLYLADERLEVDAVLVGATSGINHAVHGTQRSGSDRTGRPVWPEGPPDPSGQTRIGPPDGNSAN